MHVAQRNREVNWVKYIKENKKKRALSESTKMAVVDKFGC